jgi:CPA1 family monovalent cation:H+ antiporter
MIEHAMITLAVIVVLGIGCQWLAWWLKLPAILFLLLAGLVVGPITGFVQPDRLFGDLLFPMVSLGVAVILFEGSLTLRVSEIKGLGSVVRNLVTIGAILNAVIIAATTHLFLDFSWEMAFLFGALVSVTGPTVIVPMLRTVRPISSLANILRWEGIIIDPLGALMAVLVFEFIVSGQDHQALVVFGKMLLIGGVFGAAAAYGLATLLRRHLIPEYLHNVTTLALVVGVFTGADALQNESGLLAVTVMGMILANMKHVPIEDILDFKESLSVLLISLLFIVLAARVDFKLFADVGWGAALVFLAILFIARPVMVMVSTLGSKLKWREKALLSWVAPRGIVAAAVSALFALRLQELGFANADLLVPLTFMVIIGTVVVQSATARPLAKRLKVAEPEPRGVLIVGANLVSRTIAKALTEKNFRVVIADTYWDDIRTARMEGFATYYGNVVSEHADRHLDLVGVGRLFAMSRRPALNALACTRYKNEFGANNVYSLKTAEEKGAPEKQSIATHFTGSRLFGENVTHTMLASMISKGGEIRGTQLSENFDYTSYREKYGKGLIPLFALDGRGELRVFYVGGELEPAPGWTVVSLLPPEGEKHEQNSHKETTAGEPGAKAADSTPA